MTSTNEGKDVKINQTSGHKGKKYYIDLYNSLDARLSGESSLRERTGHLCEAWACIYSICRHALPASHPLLFGWIERHSARIILVSEWGAESSKGEHVTFTNALDAILAEIEENVSRRDGSWLPWEQLLASRARWFKGVVPDPWGHPVLKLLLNPGGEAPSDDEVIEWVKGERDTVFTTRLRQLAASRGLHELALQLVAAVMDRVRDKPVLPDVDQAQETTEKVPVPISAFEKRLRLEAGFTSDVLVLLVDFEFVMLHKLDKQARGIELAKQIPLRHGYELVQRLKSRLVNAKTSRDKKLWKNANEVATVIAQVVIARCMVVPRCVCGCRAALFWCVRALAGACPPAALRRAAAALAAPAATAAHLYWLARAVHTQKLPEDMKSFVCELYVRAITSGMNELEKLKIDADKEAEARAAEQTLATWFLELGSLFTTTSRFYCECVLTAFSVHPSPEMYAKIDAAPQLAASGKEVQEPETVKSEFGSWATDSRGKTNFVKTSETLNLKQSQNQANVLSTAILNEGEALGLGVEICQDIVVLLSGPRVKTLSWDMDRSLLLENCRTHMERTRCGTRALTTELKYLKLDPRDFAHLPEEQDDENDVYYGIEKGYEHLVELEEPEPETIWDNTLWDSEITQSCPSDLEPEIAPVSKRAKKKKLIIETDTDPLSLAPDVQRPEKKQERPHSKERSKEKRKSKERKPKERSQSIEKKPRKKKEKPAKPDNVNIAPLSRLIGIKVSRVTETIEEKVKADPNANICVTDSDYDSQGKSSLNSDEIDPNIIYDGHFSMDELKSPERCSDDQSILKNDQLNSPSRASSVNQPGMTKQGQVNKQAPNRAVVMTSAPKLEEINKKSLERPCPDNKNIFKNDELSSYTESPIKQSRATAKQGQPNKQIPNRAVVTSSASKLEIINKTNTTVSDDVKRRIAELMQFRRKKSAETSISSPSPTSTPVHANTQDLSSLIGSKILKEVPKTEPNVPKIVLTSKQTQELALLSHELKFNNNDCSGLKILNPNNIPTLPKEASMNITKDDAESTCSRVLPVKRKNLDVDKKLKQNIEQNQLLSNNQPDKPEVFVKDVKQPVKALPVNELPPAFDAQQRIFQEFIKELQGSINAGITKDKSIQPSASNAATPEVASQCAKPVTSQNKVENAPNTFARRSYMHKKQGETKPKQTNDLKIQDQLKLQNSVSAELDKRVAELTQNSNIILKQPPTKQIFLHSANSSHLNTKVEVQKIDQQTNLSKKENPTLSKFLNNPPYSFKESIPSNESLRNAYTPLQQKSSTTASALLSEKDQQDLLRQQYKLNATFNQRKSDSSTNNMNILLASKAKLKTHINIAKAHTTPNIITKKSTLKSPANIEYRNPQTVNSTNLSISKTSANTDNRNRPHMNTQNVTTSPISNVDILRTVNMIQDSKQTKDQDVLLTNTTSSAANTAQKASKSQNQKVIRIVDKCGEKPIWASVCDQLREQVTQNRGPKALDMFLNRDLYKKYVSKGVTEKQPKAILKGQQNATKTVSNSSHRELPQKSCSIKPIVYHPDTKKLVNAPAKKSYQPDVFKRLNTDAPKTFATGYQNPNDPFISGLQCSDYDLLEELMDDDLRQEMGELSDEERFDSIRTVIMDESKAQGSIKSNIVFHKSVSMLGKDNIPIIVDSRKSIHSPVNSKREINLQHKPPQNNNEIKILDNKIIVGPQEKSVVKQNVTERSKNIRISEKSVLKSMHSDHHKPKKTDIKIVQQNKPNTNEESAQNIITKNPNSVFVAALPNPVLQNVVVVSNKIYNPYPNVQAVHEDVTAGLSNLNQKSFVLSTPPSIVFQTQVPTTPAAVFLGNTIALAAANVVYSPPAPVVSTAISNETIQLNNVRALNNINVMNENKPMLDNAINQNANKMKLQSLKDALKNATLQTLPAVDVAKVLIKATEPKFCEQKELLDKILQEKPKVCFDNIQRQVFPKEHIKEIVNLRINEPKVALQIQNMNKVGPTEPKVDHEIQETNKVGPAGPKLGHEIQDINKVGPTELKVAHQRQDINKVSPIESEVAREIQDMNKVGPAEPKVAHEIRGMNKVGPAEPKVAHEIQDMNKVEPSEPKVGHEIQGMNKVGPAEPKVAHEIQGMKKVVPTEPKVAYQRQDINQVGPDGPKVVHEIQDMNKVRPAEPKVAHQRQDINKVGPAGPKVAHKIQDMNEVGPAEPKVAHQRQDINKVGRPAGPKVAHEIQDMNEVGPAEPKVAHQRQDINKVGPVESEVAREILDMNKMGTEKINFPTISNTDGSVYKDSLKLDQEKLNKKRLEIINTDICIETCRRPITLTYEPLNVNQTQSIYANSHMATNTSNLNVTNTHFINSTSSLNLNVPTENIQEASTKVKNTKSNKTPKNKSKIRLKTLKANEKSPGTEISSESQSVIKIQYKIIKKGDQPVPARTSNRLRERNQKTEKNDIETLSTEKKNDTKRLASTITTTVTTKHPDDDHSIEGSNTDVAVTNVVSNEKKGEPETIIGTSTEVLPKNKSIEDVLKDMEKTKTAESKNTDRLFLQSAATRAVEIVSSISSESKLRETKSPIKKGTITTEKNIERMNNEQDLDMVCESEEPARKIDTTSKIVVPRKVSITASTVKSIDKPENDIGNLVVKPDIIHDFKQNYTNNVKLVTNSGVTYGSTSNYILPNNIETKHNILNTNATKLVKPIERLDNGIEKLVTKPDDSKFNYILPNSIETITLNTNASKTKDIMPTSTAINHPLYPKDNKDRSGNKRIISLDKKPIDNKIKMMEPIHNSTINDFIANKESKTCNNNDKCGSDISIPIEDSDSEPSIGNFDNIKPTNTKIKMMRPIHNSTINDFISNKEPKTCNNNDKCGNDISIPIEDSDSEPSIGNVGNIKPTNTKIKMKEPINNSTINDFIANKEPKTCNNNDKCGNDISIPIEDSDSEPSIGNVGNKKPTKKVDPSNKTIIKNSTVDDDYESYKKNIVFEELPRENGSDSNKKVVRIKLPDGKSFKATICGSVPVSLNTLLDNPDVRNILKSGFSNQRYILNIQQLSSRSSNEIINTRIKNITITNRSLNSKVPEQSSDIVNLVSDDEDDDLYSFNTEFGKYSIKNIDKETAGKHQIKFSQKCMLKLRKCSSRVRKTMKHNKLSDVMTDKKKSSVLQNLVDAILSDTIIANTTNSKSSIIPRVIEIDDSSNDSTQFDNVSKSQPPEINELKDLLLKDLGVKETPMTVETTNKIENQGVKETTMTVETASKIENENLINIHQKIIPTDCFVKLVRCDKMLEDIESDPNKQIINVSDDQEDLTVISDSDTVLSRSGSLSILNILDLDAEPISWDDTDRSSPVMEIYDTIASLGNIEIIEKCPTSPVMAAFDMIVSWDRNLLHTEKCEPFSLLNMKEEISCESEWFVTKDLLRKHYQQYTVNETFYTETENKKTSILDSVKCGSDWLRTKRNESKLININKVIKKINDDANAVDDRGFLMECDDDHSQSMEIIPAERIECYSIWLQTKRDLHCKSEINDRRGDNNISLPFEDNSLDYTFNKSNYHNDSSTTNSKLDLFTAPALFTIMTKYFEDTSIIDHLKPLHGNIRLSDKPRQRQKRKLSKRCTISEANICQKINCKKTKVVNFEIMTQKQTDQCDISCTIPINEITTARVCGNIKEVSKSVTDLLINAVPKTEHLNPNPDSFNNDPDSDIFINYDTKIDSPSIIVNDIDVFFDTNSEDILETYNKVNSVACEARNELSETFKSHSTNNLEYESEECSTTKIEPNNEKRDVAALQINVDRSEDTGNHVELTPASVKVIKDDENPYVCDTEIFVEDVCEVSDNEISVDNLPEDNVESTCNDSVKLSNQVRESDVAIKLLEENDNIEIVTNKEIICDEIQENEFEENASLVYKDDSGVILKGIEYEDPVMGTCYVFPLLKSSDTSGEGEILNSGVEDVVEEILEDPDNGFDINDEKFLELSTPNVTYSKYHRKRKADMKDSNIEDKKFRRTPKIFDTKKYRKGKNIDCPKLSASTIIDSLYGKEYKRLIDYYKTVKFSFSLPFHRDYIDVPELVKQWPINTSIDNELCQDTDSENTNHNILFSEFVDTDNYTIYDPAKQTLVEEMSQEYNEDFTTIEIKENNFSMGFGERSDRVIQNLEGDLNFSAATLSDVKQSQPLLLSEDNIHGCKYAISILATQHDQREKIRRHITYIHLRDKVRSFFKKTSDELKYDSEKDSGKYDSENFPFDSYIMSNYFVPSPYEAIVQVVQVGQLPVSAAAQNPVTCDPRVTQVSDASPSQCSVENSPHDESQGIKNEYTELTTADLSMPLVQEYADLNQSLPTESQEGAANVSTTNEDIPIETDFIKSEVKVELIEETQEDFGKDLSADNEDQGTTKHVNNIDYQFESNNTSIESDSNVQLLFSSNDKQGLIDEFSQQKQNGSSEKTDQIAHAMNAAGITTTTEALPNRAHALVNLLSQKIRQGAITSSPNTYQKTTSINAMSLHQALAQILPPPLNQTNTTENNQGHNQQVTPQVLHIVQGKNSSGNQITLVDNTQQSVITGTNATPVLHIVQNKGTPAGANSNCNQQPQNTYSGLSLVDAGLQQGGNQLLHIVNTGTQKNNSAGQLLKRVNLLTNLTNVQGGNEQKMVQFVCKSADGKSIQLNAPHQRSMVLRLQPIESPNVQTTPIKPVETQEMNQNATATNPAPAKETTEIKSRSVYEENYAKFIQNSSNKPPLLESPKSTSLPKFNQAFGKQIYQDGNPKPNEMNGNNNSQIPSLNNSNTENNDVAAPENSSINLEHISQISSPPLLLRKQTNSTQAQPNLVQQIKQTIGPMNIQTMHGGVIYTRQIPVNIGGGQTINLITVPSTDLLDDSQKTSDVKFVNQGDIEPSIIKIVPQQPTASDGSTDDNNLNASSDNAQNPQPQPVLTQMRIKLPMLSKTPQMVSGARVVRPSFFQIQRNVIGGTNQPVYQQLVLTAAPPLGHQTIRLPQAQAARQVKVQSENQSSSESQMSSSTLEQLREFDMVLEQVKERSTVQPNTSSNGSFKMSTDATDSSTSASSSSTETTQQILYSIGGNQQLNVAYVNRKATVTTPASSSFVRSPDSSGIADSPTSSTSQIPHTITSESASGESSSQQKTHKVSHKSKSRPKSSSHPPNTMKINTVPPKTSAQKPLEDEQTTQRILYILAEYKEQVENSPDKDKPAPRRRSNPPSNPSGSSKRKKSSSGSRRHGARDLSPSIGDDTCRTMGSEDSSCGTSQGDCTENCLETHSPQDSPRKVARKLTFEQEQPANQTRPQPQRNVIVADGQTITVARGTAGKPTTAVLMPANYILPVSMVKGGQQIAIVTNRGPKLLTVGGGEGGATNALLLQRLISPAGLKPMLARPGVRHVRLPTAALHNLHTFNLAAATTSQPADSTASPAPESTPPDMAETRAESSPWTDRESDTVKPDRASSPEGSEPWNLPSTADPHDYTYEETVRADNLDRTVLDPIPDRYSPDMEAQRIFDKMFDVESKKSYIDTQDDSPRCGYDIDGSQDDKGYQVVQKKDGTSHRQHRLAHVSAAALRHKYAILEHELRLQKSLSEECEDLGVDSPSASELFPEAELLFAASPAQEHAADTASQPRTPQPVLSQSVIQPDIDDQIATDQLIPREPEDRPELNLGLGMVTVRPGLQPVTLDHEEFARSHPNTTFHSETDDGPVQPFTISGLKGRHITSTIFHSNRAATTVLMATPQTTVISQTTGEGSQNAVKYNLDNMINSMPGTHSNNINLSSVLVKDEGLTRFDNILTDSRELHLSNTASAIVHSSGNATQVIRRVCYDEDKRERERFLMDDPDNLIAGDDAKMIADDSDREATLGSIVGDVDDDNSSPERHAELFWESNSASERSESRRPIDFSSDSEKCCKSPSFDETNSTDSSGVGAHMRLDSVIKEARGIERTESADGSSADDTHPPLRTYPPKRLYHSLEGDMERSVSGKTRAGERSPDSLEVRRRASVRGVVKRGCHCCNGSPAPSRPKKSRQKKPTMDFNN